MNVWQDRDGSRETAVRMGLPTLAIVINNVGIGGGVMGMNRPAGTSPHGAKLGGKRIYDTFSPAGPK